MMATYTSEGEVYDAEDDPFSIHEELSAQERRNEEILKVHHFLPRRPVKIISYEETRNQGWTSGRPTSLVGKSGVITRVHDRVIEAVEVKVDEETKFWHYKDLELIESNEPPIEPVYFNPMSLVVG